MWARLRFMAYAAHPQHSVYPTKWSESQTSATEYETSPEIELRGSPHPTIAIDGRDPDGTTMGKRAGDQWAGGPWLTTIHGIVQAKTRNLLVGEHAACDLLETRCRDAVEDSMFGIELR